MAGNYTGLKGVSFCQRFWRDFLSIFGSFSPGPPLQSVNQRAFDGIPLTWTVS